LMRQQVTACEVKAMIMSSLPLVMKDVGLIMVMVLNQNDMEVVVEELAFDYLDWEQYWDLGCLMLMTVVTRVKDVT